MKALLLSIFLCLSANSAKNVYICVSPYAKKYHYNKLCRGLKNCTHTIKEVSLQEAKDLNYSICGFED